MKSFIVWIYSLALDVDEPGLVCIALVDSCFVSLLKINDILVVLMVTLDKAWM